MAPRSSAPLASSAVPPKPPWVPLKPASPQAQAPRERRYGAPGLADGAGALQVDSSGRGHAPNPPPIPARAPHSARGADEGRVPDLRAATIMRRLTRFEVYYPEQLVYPRKFSTWTTSLRRRLLKEPRGPLPAVSTRATLASLHTSPPPPEDLAWGRGAELPVGASWFQAALGAVRRSPPPSGRPGRGPPVIPWPRPAPRLRPRPGGTAGRERERRGGR